MEANVYEKEDGREGGNEDCDVQRRTWWLYHDAAVGLVMKMKESVYLAVA